MKHQMKECKKHGLVKHSLVNGRNYYRCLKCSGNTTKYRRLKIRKELIEYAGGKCCRCGYSKYSEVLEFHHKVASEKLFNICGTNVLKYSKNILQKEVDKCDLLCANCHRETHADMKDEFIYEPKKNRKSIKCAVCGNTTKNKLYCSPKCFAESKILDKPTKIDLQNLLKDYTYLELTKKLKVSRSTIFKWASDYGLTNATQSDKIKP
jgi:hypothetical protein